MRHARLKRPPESDPGSVIVDRDLRSLYEKFLGAVRNMHDEVRLEESRMETRAYFRDHLLCRVVAYRQLFHVQVGKDNVWEIRVRDRTTCSDTLDRVLEKFLDVFVSSEHSQNEESVLPE